MYYHFDLLELGGMAMKVYFQDLQNGNFNIRYRLVIY